MNRTDDIAVRVDHVSKMFKLPHEKQSSLKGLLVNFRHRGYIERQQVLRDVSFEVKKGEFFGIVGRNGSGKSTLLKMLAGIYPPTQGGIHVHGKLTPFIELGVGFNPELSGRENVFLNGALLGFNRKQMAAMYDDIVAFAELERFMDQKLKNYSSGMQVRLAFSIAIRARSDILLIDEVLAVGDANFQRKCFETFNEIKNSGRTVLFVSHDSGTIKRYCDRAILIDNGDLILTGEPEDVINKYNDINLESTENSLAKTAANAAAKKEASLIDRGVTITSTEIRDSKGKKRQAFKPHERLRVVTTFKATVDIKDPVVRMAAVHTGGGMAVFAASTKIAQTKLGNITAGQAVEVSFELENIFHDSELDIHVSVFSADEQTMLGGSSYAARFISLGWNTGIVGSIYPPVTVDIHKR